MNYTELPAPPPLDSLVHCFWFLRGPIDEVAPQTVVPDGRVELVIHLGEPFAELDERGTVRPQATALLAGQLTCPIRLMARGYADVVGIRFRTAGATAVLPFPLREVTGRVEPLYQLAPGLASAVVDVAARSSGPEARVAALAYALERLVTRAPRPTVLAAVRALGTAQAPRLQQLASRLGVTRRTLERHMLDEVGLTPKLLQSVLRFRRTLRLLDQTRIGLWGRVAVAAGYFDQAHLIRDFRRFAGSAPSAFFHRDAGLTRAFLGPEGVGP